MKQLTSILILMLAFSSHASDPNEIYRACIAACARGNHVAISCEKKCKADLDAASQEEPSLFFNTSNPNPEQCYLNDPREECKINYVDPSDDSSGINNDSGDFVIGSEGGGGTQGDQDTTTESKKEELSRQESTSGDQNPDPNPDQDPKSDDDQNPDEGKVADEETKETEDPDATTEPGLDEPVAGMDSDSIYNHYNAKIKKCEADRKFASTCCREPVRCLAESAGMENGSGVNTAAQVGMSLAQQLSMMNTDSMSSLCGNLKSLGMMGAGMNAGFGQYCSMKREVCTESCATVYQEIDRAKRECDASTTCPSETKSVYSRLAGRAGSELKACVALKEYESSYYAQAVSTGTGALLASKCEDASKVNNFSTGFENVDSQVFNTDCSDPANASNPICQSQCQRPGAANDPVCRQILGLDGAENAGLASGTSSGGSGAKGGIEQFGIYEDPDLNQPFEGSGIAPKANSADVGSQGGGGVPGGVAGGGGGGSDGASNGGGGSASSGYNTNILKGFSGGNGYSSKIANRYSASGGGFSGYGNKKSRNGGEKFNLKDYLPGGKKDPRKRRIASVYGLSKHEVQQIGKAHENIFQKVSNRYYQVCLKGLLLDCGGLFGKAK